MLFAVHVACLFCACVSIHTRGSRSIRVLAFSCVCVILCVCVCVCVCVCAFVVCVGALMYRAPGMPRSQENVSELMYLCGILHATRVY